MPRNSRNSKDSRPFESKSVGKILVGNLSTYPVALFHNKLALYGLSETEQIITEYNLGQNFHETVSQSSHYISGIAAFGNNHLDGHAFAALQDFQYDPLEEFHQDWGTISRGGLMKPVFYAGILINRLLKGNQLLPVESSQDLSAFASINADTFRLLIANPVWPPEKAAYEALLFGSNNINVHNLSLAGYTSFEQIDSTILGLISPIGPPEVIAAFADAQAAYTHAENYLTTAKTVQLTLANSADYTHCKRYIVDQNHSNTIARYDSLITLAGYTRTQALDSLLPDQSIYSDTITLTGDTTFLHVAPNAVWLLEYLRTDVSDLSHEIPKQPMLYPNPVRDNLTIQHTKPFTFTLFDSYGKKVLSKAFSAGLNWHHFAALENGCYFYLIVDSAKNEFRGKLIVNH